MSHGTLQVGRFSRELTGAQATVVVVGLVAVMTAYVIGVGWLLLAAYNALARWTQRRAAGTS